MCKLAFSKGLMLFFLNLEQKTRNSTNYTYINYMNDHAIVRHIMNVYYPYGGFIGDYSNNIYLIFPQQTCGTHLLDYYARLKPDGIKALKKLKVYDDKIVERPKVNELQESAFKELSYAEIDELNRYPEKPPSLKYPVDYNTEMYEKVHELRILSEMLSIVIAHRKNC